MSKNNLEKKSENSFGQKMFEKKVKICEKKPKSLTFCPPPADRGRVVGGLPDVVTIMEEKVRMLNQYKQTHC